MHKIIVSVEKAAALSNYIAAFSVVAMMLLTCTDVILRLVRHPIPGTYEIVGLAGTMAASLALGSTTLEKSHIAVDFLTRKLPRRLQHTIDGLNGILAFAFFGLASWRSALYADDLRRVGEVSLTIQWPLYPFAYGISLGCAILAMVCLVFFSSSLIRGWR